MENTVIDNFDSNQNENQVTGNVESSTQKKLRFNNLTESQKKTLMSGGSALAGMMMGAGAFVLMGFANKDGHVASAPQAEADANECVDVFTDAPIASSVSSEMSFSEAFEAARNEVGAGGFFTHNGQVYNTYTKEEWDQMSDLDKTDYANSMADKVQGVQEVHAGTEGNNATTSKVDVEPQTVDEKSNSDHADKKETNEVNEEKEDVQAIEENTEVDSNLLEISEDDILHKIDEGSDYVIDGYEVDFDKDEYFDAIIDADRDGKFDELILDVNNPDGHGSIIDIQPIDTENLDHLDKVDADGNLIVERNAPEAGKEVEIANGEISITSEDLENGFDLNQDGIDETFVVDANNNKIGDIAIDLDGDNKIDNVFMDVNSVEKDMEIQEYLNIRAEVETEMIIGDILKGEFEGEVANNDLADDLQDDLQDDLTDDLADDLADDTFMDA